MGRSFFTKKQDAQSVQEKLEREFSQAFDEYADALYRHAFFRTNNAEQSQDLVQQAFMKSWDSARKSGKVSNWRALLYKIMNNLIIDYYRKRKDLSLDKILEEDEMPEGAIDGLVQDADFESEFDKAEELKKLSAELNSLQENDKNIIIMRVIDNMPAKEVAKILDIKENAVHTRLHRALERLKAKFNT